MPGGPEMLVVITRTWVLVKNGFLILHPQSAMRRLSEDPTETGEAVVKMIPACSQRVEKRPE